MDFKEMPTRNWDFKGIPPSQLSGWVPLAWAYASRSQVKMLRFTTILLLLTLPLCADDSDLGFAYTLTPGELAAHIEKMNLSDGVDTREAGILAVSYYIYFGGLSGAALPVQLKGNWWHSETMVDIGGRYAGDIRIHRMTGIITWTGGKWTQPPYTKMKAHLVSLQNAMDRRSQ